MELKIWQIVVMVVGTFDIAFMLGAFWATRDRQELFIDEQPDNKPAPYQHTVKYMMDGNYGKGLK